MDQIYIWPKNWGTFQHYGKRRPPWIKLHRGLLDDYAFHCLHDASRALAPCLWLLASEYSEGKIPANVTVIAFRMRMSEKRLLDGLIPLIEAGFFGCSHDASALLATCKHDASNMLSQRRGEVEGEKTPSASSKTPQHDSNGAFESFWTVYPRRVGKGNASKAFNLALRKVALADLMAGASRAAKEFAGTDPKFIPYPATWLNGERWLDQPPAKSKHAYSGYGPGYDPSVPG